MVTIIGQTFYYQGRTRGGPSLDRTSVIHQQANALERRMNETINDTLRERPKKKKRDVGHLFDMTTTASAAAPSTHKNDFSFDDAPSAEYEEGKVLLEVPLEAVLTLQREEERKGIERSKRSQKKKMDWKWNPNNQKKRIWERDEIVMKKKEEWMNSPTVRSKEDGKRWNEYHQGLSGQSPLPMKINFNNNTNTNTNLKNPKNRFQAKIKKKSGSALRSAGMSALNSSSRFNPPPPKHNTDVTLSMELPDYGEDPMESSREEEEARERMRRIAYAKEKERLRRRSALDVKKDQLRERKYEYQIGQSMQVPVIRQRSDVVAVRSSGSSGGYSQQFEEQRMKRRRNKTKKENSHHSQVVGGGVSSSYDMYGLNRDGVVPVRARTRVMSVMEESGSGGSSGSGGGSGGLSEMRRRYKPPNQRAMVDVQVNIR